MTVEAQINVADDSATYKVGTLTYTRFSLAGVFFWLLWGDFCFTLMETVMPTLMPLTLKDAGASNFWVGMIVVTIPGLMTALFNPVISFKSDRYRGKMGRRIPFLLWSAPFITLFLIFTAYAPRIGTWLHGWIAARTNLPETSRTYVILGVLAFCSIGFQFFNLFAASVFYYLQADVVPERVMGRFIASFRLVGYSAGWVWSFYLFGLSKEYAVAIYTGIGLLYLVAFTLMCFRVKEGTYPPPPVQTGGVGLLGSTRTYIQECFGNRYYVWIFAAMALIAMGACCQPFIIFFYLNTLELTRDQVGKIGSWCLVLSLVISFPLGYTSDRFHPMRMMIVCVLGLLAMSAVSFIFIHDHTTLLITLLLSTIPQALYGTLTMPLFIALLPKDRFGQFCSAISLLTYIGKPIGTAIGGLFLDWMRDYRYIYIWQVVVYGLAMIPLMKVYFNWRSRGGVYDYTPPPIEKKTDLTAPGEMTYLVSHDSNE